MREVRPEEIPVDGGTAVQEDPDRPVFRGNGEFDYICASCGTVLAAGWDPAYMTRRVRIRCAPLPDDQHRRRAVGAGRPDGLGRLG